MHLQQITVPKAGGESRSGVEVGGRHRMDLSGTRGKNGDNNIALEGVVDGEVNKMHWIIYYCWV